MRYLYLFVLFLLPGLTGFSQEQAASNSVQADFNRFSRYEGTSATGSAVSGVSGHNTEGKRLLFDSWVKGTVVTTNNATFNATYLYNFDLLNNELLIKPVDSINVFVVDKSQTKSFALDNNGTSYYFEKQPSLEKKPATVYYQVIGRGKKYALYKENKVKLEKADPHDRSQFVRGVIYDEYVKEDFYYAVMPDQSVHPFKLNKKNLFKAFPQEESKIEAYISAHSDDRIDDAFLAGLMSSLNE